MYLLFIFFFIWTRMRPYLPLTIEHPRKNLRLTAYHELVHFEHLVIAGLDNEIGILGRMKEAGTRSD